MTFKNKTTRFPQTTTGTKRNLLLPIIALLGLYKFSTSFFLAKKSMSHISPCQPDSASQLLQDVLHLSTNDISRLINDGILSKYDNPNKSNDNDNNNENQQQYKAQGCWMPRHVDAMAIVVVDALRFDFALERLPKSIGARLNQEEDIKEKMKQIDRTKQYVIGQRGLSQLFQFVADPPTVTMQRLKGLTTGGLPTFADISGSFGGASVDEDSWVQQLHDTPILHRNGKTFMQELKENNEQTKDEIKHAKIAFVGDDTWVDLFPHQFHDSHPYPSFNTRDLDTVDNGCLKHLPRLFQSFGPNSSNSNTTGMTGYQKDFFEVIVTHFLGVDHVGHTYGPHNIHMDQKLAQVDDALETILSKIDTAKTSCYVAFVFGDHGMTEDGNHGGGTSDETNAALFAHFSPGCGDLGPSLDITGSEIGSHSEKAFQSINQIDLVPTISLLLGLPIPYANLGGMGK